MAFNKQHQRQGNLFQRPFKRVEVIKESHFTEAIIYIHRNARHHNLCKDFTSHEWSSWHTMHSDKPTLLKREEVLNWFGGKQQFIDVHKTMSDLNDNCHVAIEDDDLGFWKPKKPKPFKEYIKQPIKTHKTIHPLSFLKHLNTTFHIPPASLLPTCGQ
jgi:hypothetical protein